MQKVGGSRRRLQTTTIAVIAICFEDDNAKRDIFLAANDLNMTTPDFVYVILEYRGLGFSEFGRLSLPIAECRSDRPVSMNSSDWVSAGGRATDKNPANSWAACVFELFINTTSKAMLVFSLAYWLINGLSAQVYTSFSGGDAPPNSDNSLAADLSGIPSWLLRVSGERSRRLQSLILAGRRHTSLD